MKTTSFLMAALAVSPFLCAQEGKEPPATAPMANPKTNEHTALAAFVGQWRTSMKQEAMPGVPGMEEAHESTGTERTELLCDGLWLKATTEGTCADGKPFQGLWLVGYDPWNKAYTAIHVCNLDEPSTTATGTYDAAKNTWTFTGSSPIGSYRSVHAWQDADTSTETCYVVGADGKEAQCMQIVRKRMQGARAADAAVSFGKPASKELALLAEGTGTWDAIVKSSAPDGSPIQDTGTERVVPICEGKWFWSDWTGTMMGAPFEGHALTGYEPATKQFVSYWIDSTSAVHSRTSGTYDEAKKMFVMKGSGLDMTGKPMTIEQTATHGKDTRTMQMKMQNAAMTHAMEIAYKRAKG